MKIFRSLLLSISVIALGIPPVTAQTLYLTGRSDTVRSSSDGSATQSTFATVSGGQLRGVDAGNVGGNNYVFTNNLNGGVDETARPLLAYNAAGPLVTSTTYNRVGAFNEQPVGYFGGRVYGSAGGTPQNFYASFNGTAFGTVAASGVGSWQGNNIAFASSGGTNNLYTIGTRGTTVRRTTLDGAGFGIANVGASTTGGPANITDIAWPSSGRLMTIGSIGIFLSAANNVTTNAITLTSAFAFGATENALTGDMGSNARDFSLLGSTLYGVTDTRVFSYQFDDTAGTLTSLNAFTLGFNSTGVQISAIPEPSTYAMFLVGGIAVLLLRRRLRA